MGPVAYFEEGEIACTVKVAGINGSGVVAPAFTVAVCRQDALRRSPCGSVIGGAIARVVIAEEATVGRVCRAGYDLCRTVLVAPGVHSVEQNVLRRAHGAVMYRPSDGVLAAVRRNGDDGIGVEVALNVQTIAYGNALRALPYPMTTTSFSVDSSSANCTSILWRPPTATVWGVMPT